MSKVQPSISAYGTDSSLNYSESPLSSEATTRGPSMLSSDGSSIDLTDRQSETTSSDSIADDVGSVSAKTDSVKSLWSMGDSSSGVGDDISNSKPSRHFVPNEASPFVYDGNVIRYNTERGVDYTTPVLFGSRKTYGFNGKHGYRSSHFIFDPALGTLAAGFDINNGWQNLPKFSLISGFGNVSDIDASILSGSHNKILLELLPKQSDDVHCVSPSSCAIIGGSNNTITNTSGGQFSSTIIASSGMHLTNCNETVVLAMKSQPGETPLSGLNESTVTRNLYGLNRIHAGYFDDKVIPPGTVFHTNGNSLFSGNIKVSGTLDAEEAYVKILKAGHIVQHDRYVKGHEQNGPTGNLEPNLIIKKGDGVDIVYANPIPGIVYIQLGTPNDSVFESNRTIVIKDVTMEFGATSSNNIIIYIPQISNTGPTAGSSPYPKPGLARMEFYTPTTSGLAIATNEFSPVGYVLNTVAGSVTLRYIPSLEPGALSTWAIENQFIGNSRISPATGLTFIPASDCTRSKIIRK